MFRNMTSLPTMSSVLEKLNLGCHTENFLKEKITPDIVCHLSLYDLNQLGINHAIYVQYRPFDSNGQNTFQMVQTVQMDNICSI